MSERSDIAEDAQRIGNRTVLITGGSRGIGAAMTRQFSSEGYRTAFTYKEEESRAHELAHRVGLEFGSPAHTVRMDLGIDDSIRSAIDEAAHLLGGRIDVLVNNAGYADMLDLEFAAVSRSTLDRTIQTNVIGPFLVTQAALPYIPAGGAIVNIGSCLGARVPAQGLTTYATGKAAMAGFTRGLARDLRRSRIRVNEIAPGPVDTDMNPQDGPTADFQRSLTILDRYARPAEIARATVFLAGEDASYVTGTTLAVDGGTNT